MDGADEGPEHGPLAAAHRGVMLTSVALTLGLTGAPTSARADDYTDVHRGFAPASTRLRDSSPQRAGLNPAPIEAAKAQVAAYTRPQANGRPLHPGYAGVMGHEGKIVATHVGGHALLYQNATQTLPEPEQIAVRENTIFDLASVSKLFTSLVAVQLVEEGRIRLGEPVSTYLPEFASNGKQDITVRQLLTHTSGLQNRLIKGPLAISGERRWRRAEAAVPAGTVVVRWKHTTDDHYLGRGVYVDTIGVRGRGGRLDAERHHGLLKATTWQQSSN